MDNFVIYFINKYKYLIHLLFDDTGIQQSTGQG